MILASELILKILLTHTYVEDKLFWPYVSNGIYSVKSGYNFLAKEKSSLLLIPNSQVDVRSIRKQLWSLLVPNKVKNFQWRACKEAILVKKNLVRQRVLDEDVYCHCNQAIEDVLHVLWDCPTLSPIWEADMMWLFRGTKKFSNFFELVSYTLEERKNSELLATLVWFIWYCRNLVWTNNKPFPISQVVPLASQTLQDFFSDFIDPKDTRSCYA